MSILINSIGSCLMQYSFVFSLELTCFLISPSTFNIKLHQLILSGLIHFLLSGYFTLNLIIFQSKQMGLFLHVFQLGSNVKVLVCGRRDLSFDVGFVRVLFDQQISILKLEFNHVFTKDIIISNFGLLLVDFSL